MVIKIVLSSEYLVPPLSSFEEEDTRETRLLEVIGQRETARPRSADVDTAAISETLRENIRVWDEEFQETFDENYPPNSGFTDEQSKEAHIKKGELLANQLRAELPADFIVEYTTL